FGRTVHVGDIRARADCHEQALAIGRKREIASGVASVRKPFNDCLRGSSGFEVSILVRYTDYGSRVSDVDPLRVGSWRLKRNSERCVQAGNEGGDLLRGSVLRNSVQDLDRT